ncbi:signal peptidase II [Cerasicoccus arenae]|uniref:Lipoprotein signal peptidase n=1 Tax=Cerasicoccus arenae TaxID=424488 RepID=A0A8J3DFG8_9BACT|nr:signal peptidase II [Cerasicoccus arenae]MBK1857456.1 signal peptidase II [Cerasicoccus arenae]GHB95128.1 lipoprotein signal peptidase [Cerasicoccus arenae]
MDNTGQVVSDATKQDVAAPARVNYARLWIIAAVVLILDQVSKLWIVNTVPPGASPYDGGLIAVIPGFFYIIHVYNDGAAWGMFSGYSYILGFLGAIALGAIFYFRQQLELYRPFVQVIFGLLIGGIVGNMIDRFAYGHVVDFLDFHFGSYRYPAFNIADSGITVGVALYVIASVIESFRDYRAKKS